MALIKHLACIQTFDISKHTAHTDSVYIARCLSKDRESLCVKQTYIIDKTSLPAPFAQPILILKNEAFKMSLLLQHQCQCAMCNRVCPSIQIDMIGSGAGRGQSWRCPFAESQVQGIKCITHEQTTHRYECTVTTCLRPYQKERINAVHTRGCDH